MVYHEKIGQIAVEKWCDMAASRNPDIPQKRYVFLAIRDRIQFLDYKPGEKINEKELASEFAISRTPVREALLLLSDEKLVDIFPQSGTYVSKIKLSMVVELVYMRHILEAQILDNLCAKQARVYDAVAKTLVLQAAAIEAKDVIEFMKYDDEFHHILFGLAGSYEIWRIISNTRAHHTRFRVLDLQLPSGIQSSYEEHKQIVDLIQSGKRAELKAILDLPHDTELMNKSVIVSKYQDYFV